MDMQEIMSTVRDLTQTLTEGELGVPLLKRYTNMAQDKLSQLLMPLMSDWLVKPISGTGSGDIILTGDVVQVMDASRGTTLIPCEKVPVEHKNMIGRSLNHPGTAEFPAFVHEGSKISFFPALLSTPYALRYRRRLVPMIEGTMTYVSTATVTLSADALAIDDYYNDYQLSLYLDTNGVKTACQVFRITDYVGSTKLATVTPATVVNQTTYGALWSLIPAEYHQLLVDMTMWFLAKHGKYKADPTPIFKSIMEAIYAEMKITLPTRKTMDDNG